MGCCCKKKSQLNEQLTPVIEEEEIEEEEEIIEKEIIEEEEEEEEEIKEEVKEEIKEEVKEEIFDPFELEYEKARKIVRLCLNEDNLYGRFSNDISKFNNDQFKNLFKGNLDYKNYPEFIGIEKIEFIFLLMRFEDYYALLFNWYTDESKYENIVKLWNSKLCIYKMKNNSDYELRQILYNLNIKDIDNFIYDFRLIIEQTKESKSSNIRNYLEYQYKDFDELIEITKNTKKEINKSNIKDKNDIENVLTNIVGELAKNALPLIKNYLIKNYPNLKELSELDIETLGKIKNNLIDLYTSENKSIFAKGIDIDTVSTLVDSYKSGNLFNKISSECGLHFGNQTVLLTTLATSFLNLTASLKSYYDYNLDTENYLKEFNEKKNIINENFEKHKELIKKINTENYDESIQLIQEIGKNLNKDKEDLVVLIEGLKEQEKKTEQKKSFFEALPYGGGFALCAIGAFFTCGATAIAYGVGAVANGTAVAVNLLKIKKILKDLEEYKNKIIEQENKQNEIDKALKDLRDKYIQTEQRYIPKNVKI